MEATKTESPIKAEPNMRRQSDKAMAIWKVMKTNVSTTLTEIELAKKERTMLTKKLGAAAKQLQKARAKLEAATAAFASATKEVAHLRDRASECDDLISRMDRDLDKSAAKTRAAYYVYMSKNEEADEELAAEIAEAQQRHRQQQAMINLCEFEEQTQQAFVDMMVDVEPLSP